MKRYLSVMVAAIVAAGMGSGATAGSLDPTGAPAPTMHTLEQIYQKVLWISTDVVGVIVATNVQVTYNGGVPKTGQTPTTPVAATNGWDGWYQKGVAWPNPRFTVGTGISSNCVTDNLTGLMWLRNPDATARDWATAVAYCENLDGAAGRGGTNEDWRLPNVKELQSLIDFRYGNPAVPNTAGTGHCLNAGDPFAGIQDAYWSSTKYATGLDGFSWVMLLSDGGAYNDGDGAPYYVWPVRGGQ